MQKGGDGGGGVQKGDVDGVYRKVLMVVVCAERC